MASIDFFRNPYLERISKKYLNAWIQEKFFKDILKQSLRTFLHKSTIVLGGTTIPTYILGYIPRRAHVKSSGGIPAGVSEGILRKFSVGIMGGMLGETRNVSEGIFIKNPRQNCFRNF